MGDRNASHPLTIDSTNEDIRYVEDDESSSDHRHLHQRTPEVSAQAPVQSKEVVAVENTREGSYAEIAELPISVPKHPVYRQKEKPRSELNQKSRRPSDLVLNIFSRTPSFRKSRQEYEKVSTREDSSHSNIVESPSSPSKTSNSVRGTSFRLRGSEMAFRKPEGKGEDEEQILEVLRQVVRKCTNPDPMKRFTSTDVLDLVDDSPES